MTRLHSMPQGSPEWLAARCGSLGASAVHEAVARTKTGWGASRTSCLARLVVEQLTGVPQDTYQTAAMLQGLEREPDARIAYEFLTDATVDQIGLVRHPTIDGTHASPDGLVSGGGLIELKCPQPAQHLATLTGEPIADRYLIQMQWQMRCCDQTWTDRTWTDFVSYNPDFPTEMQLYVTRVERDDKRIGELETLVTDFLHEVTSTVETLRRLYGGQPSTLRDDLERSLEQAEGET